MFWMYVAANALCYKCFMSRRGKGAQAKVVPSGAAAGMVHKAISIGMAASAEHEATSMGGQ